MKDSILFKLLLSIKGNGSVTTFLKDGYKYSQIAKFVNYVVKEEFVGKNEKGTLVLSEKGNNKIKELNKKYSRVNSNQWIAPDDSSKISKLGENDIYLPIPNKFLFFLLNKLE